MSSPTPAKLARLSCPINHLADEDLAAIFKRLPPYERLIVSEVCRHWRDISRKSWLDVKTLNLGPIPCEQIGAVIRQCANLQHVFAVNKWFVLNALAGLSKISSLSRARFYECHFEVKKSASDAFSAIFSDHLRAAAWIELVMHNATFLVPSKHDSGDRDEQNCKSYEHESDDEYDCDDDEDNKTILEFCADALPSTLSRLQLSGLRWFDSLILSSFSFLHGLERLENLECLILHNTPDPYGLPTDYDREQLVGEALLLSGVFGAICRLKNLKELCLGPTMPIIMDSERSSSLADLPKLEVLCINSVHGDDFADHLMKFIGTKSVLRILVVSGAFNTRKRVVANERMPPLHVFLGKRALAKIRFANKPGAPNTAIVQPINMPMPELLGREDIAPLFEGVWVAEKIKELTKTGGKLWRYASDC